MPSAQDLMNELVLANQQLGNINTGIAAVKASTDAVKASVDQVNATLINGFGQLVALGQYANQALYHNDQQNDTIICILEHISKNTCALLNEAVIQTRVHTELEKDVDGLESMFATANPGAALEFKRREKLKEQIEKCCPPPQPEVPCSYVPCPAPKPIGPPPQKEPPPR
ncbi:MAG: hypothetical protein JO366_00725 [Methylobacteriaceae bacterium]|nr:hypothetical protein [Methylobacteriaceae bacterium]